MTYRDPAIFGALNILFAAEKKLSRKTRRKMTKGLLNQSEFVRIRIAQSKAFDKRYDAIYAQFGT